MGGCKMHYRVNHPSIAPKIENSINQKTANINPLVNTPQFEMATKFFSSITSNVQQIRPTNISNYNFGIATKPLHDQNRASVERINNANHDNIVASVAKAEYFDVNDNNQQQNPLIQQNIVESSKSRQNQAVITNHIKEEPSSLKLLVNASPSHTQR